MEIYILYMETILISRMIMGFGVAQTWVQILFLHLLMRELKQDI